MPCNAGSYGAGANASCVVCSSGFADLDSNPSTQCELCSVGRFASVNATACTTCQNGTADTDLDPSTQCAQCTAGQHSSPMATNCTKCSAGQYDHDSSAVTPCQQCPNGFQSVAGLTSCPAQVLHLSFAVSFDDIQDSLDEYKATFVASLASSLGVPQGRIVILSVQPGSVVVSFFFAPPEQASANSTQNETAPSIEALQQQLNESVTYGTLSLNTSLGSMQEPVDCDGSWSTCAANCGDKVYSITIQRQGAGAECPTPAGATAACSAGEGECPPNIACSGGWGSCDSSCERVYTVQTAKSGLGAACPYSHGATDDCAPGVGDCPANVHCKGEWSLCGTDCQRKYNIITPQSGAGLHCPATNGVTQTCPFGTGACEEQSSHLTFLLLLVLAAMGGGAYYIMKVQKGAKISGAGDGGKTEAHGMREDRREAPQEETTANPLSLLGSRVMAFEADDDNTDTTLNMLNEWTENTVTTVTTTVKRPAIEVSDEEEDTTPTEALRQLQALQQERQQEAAATARRNGGAFKLGSTSQEDEV
eukprot:COSAG05_NODE_78_length_21399_cov_26.298216_24_plen_535_part_00